MVGGRERELFKTVAQNCEYKPDAGTVPAKMHSLGSVFFLVIGENLFYLTLNNKIARNFNDKTFRRMAVYKRILKESTRIKMNINLLKPSGNFT
jgi:hypothetical protein